MPTPLRSIAIVGALAFCLTALPGTASAAIGVKYFANPVTNQRTLIFSSDDAADTITPGCSNGYFTLNGTPILIQKLLVACSGEFGPENLSITGGGGDDTVDLRNVTHANFDALGHVNDVRAPTDEVQVDGGAGHDTMIGGPLGERFNDSFTESETGVGDTVHGNGGNDKIRGTTGNGDNLFGDAGNDTVVGEGGADVAHGGAGNDSLAVNLASSQPVKFYGEAGKDYLVGDAGNDLLDGGAGNDIMSGNGGKDKMYGRGGGDGMGGGAGADTIFGNAGNDDILGGPGKDKINGGSGKNKIRQ
jgi:Ca2+-binding RTX toxin-like protein